MILQLETFTHSWHHAAQEALGLSLQAVSVSFPGHNACY